MYKLTYKLVIIIMSICFSLTVDSNPYQSEAKSAEFFSCGFLNETMIFVADSLVDEVRNDIVAY